MDEISLAAPTDVAELKHGEIVEYSIEPEDFGINKQAISSLVVDNAAQSLALIKQALSGEPGPAADILALNAGAAIYVAGRSENVVQGVQMAQHIMQQGIAWQLITDLSEFTQSFS